MPFGTTSQVRNKEERVVPPDRSEAFRNAATYFAFYAILSVLLICVLLTPNFSPGSGKIMAPLLVFLIYRTVLA